MGCGGVLTRIGRRRDGVASVAAGCGSNRSATRAAGAGAPQCDAMFLSSRRLKPFVKARVYAAG